MEKKNYQVEITWELRFWVDVEAKTEEEAKEKAHEEWNCSDEEQSITSRNQYPFSYIIHLSFIKNFLS